jgi:hypothetical protein
MYFVCLVSTQLLTYTCVMCYRSAFFVQKSTVVERNIDFDPDSADWSALTRFKELIKKTLGKRVEKSKQQRQHATPLATPRSIASPVTAALTPVAPSTVASI